MKATQVKYTSTPHIFTITIQNILASFYFLKFIHFFRRCFTISRADCNENYYSIPTQIASVRESFTHMQVCVTFSKYFPLKPQPYSNTPSTLKSKFQIYLLELLFQRISMINNYITITFLLLLSKHFQTNSSVSCCFWFFFHRADMR